MSYTHNLSSVKSVLKKNDFIIILSNSKNKISKNIDYSIEDIKICDFFQLHHSSKKRLFLNSFFTHLESVYNFKIIEIISNTFSLTKKQKYNLFFIRLNNTFYLPSIFDYVYFFNYYQTYKLYYKVFYSLFMKISQNNVI